MAIFCAQEVCGWINAKATKPVWAKMTPNITDIAFPARTALTAGCEGVAAINTITSVMGINLETLRPEPSVEGYTTPGGYSSRAVKPIALAKVGFHPSSLPACANGLHPCTDEHCVSSIWTACFQSPQLRGASPWAATPLALSSL